MMVFLRRKPIKKEGYGEEGHSKERRDEKEMKGINKYEKSKKKFI